MTEYISDLKKNEIRINNVQETDVLTVTFSQTFRTLQRKVFVQCRLT